MPSPPLPVNSLAAFRASGAGKLYLRALGPNGSGKSAFGRLLQANDPHAFRFTVEGGRLTLGTVFPTLGWGAVGLYTSPSAGGADSIKEMPRIMEAIYRLAETRLHIFLEGIIVSSAGKRFFDIDLGVQRNFGRRALLLYLDYPVEECLRRVYARNGGKPFNETHLRRKHRDVLNVVRRYEERIALGAPLTLYRESTPGLPEMLASILGRVKEFYGADCLCLPG